MPARSLRKRALAAVALMLPAAVPAPLPRLSYDPGVYLAGACLSPVLTGCNAAARANASASQALLEADDAARLPFTLTGLLDFGPEVIGGAKPSGRELR